MAAASISEALLAEKLDTGATEDTEAAYTQDGGIRDDVGEVEREGESGGDRQDFEFSGEREGDRELSQEEREPIEAEGEAEEERPAPDYEKIIERELSELRRTVPELYDISDITELENPMRYAALRDLGLSAREAYLATSERRARRDNRAHLTPAAPRRAGSPGGTMSREELSAARELFGGMGDAELVALYKRVAR